MSFYDWVKSLPVLDIPEGDLVGDIQRDKKFPHNIDSLKTLLDYLPDDDAIQDAAKSLFASYLEETRHRS